jgi:hypothetical protein
LLGYLLVKSWQDVERGDRQGRIYRIDDLSAECENPKRFTESVNLMIFLENADNDFGFKKTLTI